MFHDSLKRLFIVDDHRIVREGLKKIFSGHDGFLVVGEAGTVAESLRLCAQSRPQLVLLDQNLPDGSGVELAERLLAEQPGLKCILLTGFDLDSKSAELALRCCATILFKDASAAEIVSSVDRALGTVTEAAPAVPGAALSGREEEILGFIALGLQNKEIAPLVGISEKSVRNIVTRLFRKLGVANRTEAALVAATRPRPDRPD